MVQVLGYHGTTSKVAELILRNGFKPRHRSWHWLGQGVYFWQDAPQQAWEWAEQNAANAGLEPAVIEAKIDLDGCMDFLDIGWLPVIEAARGLHKEMYEHLGLPEPEQAALVLGAEAGPNRLDCDVLDHCINFLNTKKVYVRSVRAAFLEGKPVYESSHLFTRTHVQIAVRDLSVIKNLNEIGR